MSKRSAQVRENVAIVARGPLPDDMLRAIDVVTPELPESLITPPLWPAAADAGATKHVLRPSHDRNEYRPRISNSLTLSGRAALITGARGYLGRAMADALAEAGARVVVSSRNIDHARTVAAELGGKEAGHHLAVCLDHLDEASIAAGL